MSFEFPMVVVEASFRCCLLLNRMECTLCQHGRKGRGEEIKRVMSYFKGRRLHGFRSGERAVDIMLQELQGEIFNKGGG